MCLNNRMFYQYSEHYDLIGEETYTERTRFLFKCQLNRFANDKIRIFFKIPDAHGVAKGVFSNDAKLAESGKKSLNKSEEIMVPFKKSVAVKM